MRIVGFWQLDEVEVLTCDDCTWSGPVKDCARELHEALMEIECPECSRRLMRVDLPGRTDTTTAAAAGVPGAAAEARHGPIADFASDVDGMRHAILRPDLTSLAGCAGLVWRAGDEVHEVEARKVLALEQAPAWGEPPNFLGVGDWRAAWVVPVDQGERAFLDVTGREDELPDPGRLPEGTAIVRDGRTLWPL